MKYLEDFHKLRIFHKKDIVKLVSTENAAKEILRRYKKLNFISQVRRDLYVVTDLPTKQSLASKYEIASYISPSSYLSYHAALEYYGLAHQVFYEIYISSKEEFRNFDYEGISYTFCPSKTGVGVTNPFTDSFVKVTDLERTVIDCINRIDLSGGLEELVQCFAIITYVNENKLLHYLQQYNTKILYQKVGFMLRYFQKEMRLSDSFFDVCKKNMSNNTGFLTYKQESNTYFKEWKLYAPENILSFLEQGGNDYV